MSPPPMHADLKAKLAEIREKRGFVAREWIDKKLVMFNDYMRKCGLKAAVVSVSGGVDSAVTLALTLAASRLPDSPIERVVGIAQPIHSTEKIWRRALELKEALRADIVTVDQTDSFDLLAPKVETALGVDGKDFARGQLKSYMRTPVGYYAAQLLSQRGTPAVVMGTGNRDEDGYLMYFCKAGDGVVDVQLIADLHKSEVFTVGRTLGVPASILDAPPSADLWDGQTDEDELGFTYDFVELYTEWMDLPEAERTAMRASLCAEAGEEWDKSAAAADAVHRRNAHKGGVVNLNVYKQ